MADPLYSDRWTQMFVVTPNPGPISGPNLPQRVAPSGNVTRISGFMVDVDGTITFEPAESNSVIAAMPVKAGVQYRIACKRVIAVTGASTVWGAI